MLKPERPNRFGSRAFLELVEFLNAPLTVSPDTYARRIEPLLVSPDPNGRSGAMSNKAKAILPSSGSTELPYADAVLAASEAILAGTKQSRQRKGASA